MPTLSSPQPSRRVGPRRAALAALAALVVAAPAGWAYERHAVARDARLWQPIGRRVDIGGHRLHLVCDGSGTPTVLFETSGFSNSTSYAVARDALTRHTRVCVYDRVGVGWSDPAPRTVTAGMLVDDLRGLQDAASLDGRLIIVASSIGGLTAELFARRYPDRVAALLFLDAANSDVIERLAPSISLATALTSCAAISAMGAVGVMRMVDPWNQRESRATARSAALLYGAKPWLELCALVRGAQQTRRDFRDAPPLRRELPVTAFSAATADELLPPPVWRLLNIDRDGLRAALQTSLERLAAGSSRGIWRQIPNSTHLIAASQPQAVVDGVIDLLAYTRSSTTAQQRQ
jgi:pimeloyl-ACP methyl ester carboxylesterase